MKTEILSKRSRRALYQFVSMVAPVLPYHGQTAMLAVHEGEAWIGYGTNIQMIAVAYDLTKQADGYTDTLKDGRYSVGVIQKTQIKVALRHSAPSVVKAIPDDWNRMVDDTMSRIDASAIWKPRHGEMVGGLLRLCHVVESDVPAGYYLNSAVMLNVLNTMNNDFRVYPREVEIQYSCHDATCPVIMVIGRFMLLIPLENAEKGGQILTQYTGPTDSETTSTTTTTQEGGVK